MRNQFFCGDVIEILKTFPDESVQMVVTSPPFYGLRDYGTGKWEGGDPNCTHKHYLGEHGDASVKQKTSQGTQQYNYKGVCGICGAKRTDNQIGLEKTPEEYIEKLVKVFREIKRVLRSDGVVWINIGDSYAREGGKTQGKSRHWDGRKKDPTSDAIHARSLASEMGLKPKDLIGIPYMLAFALRQDGWYWRDNIIWAKSCSGNYMGGSVMPESVTDRTTKSFEHIFMFSKSQKYFYDSEAIKEPNVDPDRTNYTPGKETYKTGNVHDDSGRERRNDGFQKYAEGAIPSGRNRRSVWVINPRPFREAHFATYNPELIIPCIKAGTSEHGCCGKCGAPYKRVVEKSPTPHDDSTESLYPENSTGKRISLLRQAMRERGEEYLGTITKTLRFDPTCKCNAPIAKCIVLDPFMGSGTTAVTAASLGRDFVGIDLNPKYVEMAKRRYADEVNTPYKKVAEETKEVEKEGIFKLF
jgi:DNA modification methylase